MSVSVVTDLKLEVANTVALNVDGVTDPVVTEKITSQSTLNATSTPPATKSIKDQRTLSAGADTIDLTAAPGPTVNGTACAVDMSGLKVQRIKIKAKSTNTAVVVFTKGATNGYELFGGSAGKISLGAGDEVLFVFNDTLADIDSTHKNIDVASTDVDAIYDIQIVAG